MMTILKALLRLGAIGYAISILQREVEKDTTKLLERLVSAYTDDKPEPTPEAVNGELEDPEPDPEPEPPFERGLPLVG